MSNSSEEFHRKNSVQLCHSAYVMCKEDYELLMGALDELEDTCRQKGLLAEAVGYANRSSQIYTILRQMKK